MSEQLISEKQALQVVISILSKEKTPSDFGSSVLKESMKHFEGRLFVLEQEERAKEEVKKRPVMCNAPFTDEVYDKFYPKFWVQALPVDRQKK